MVGPFQIKVLENLGTSERHESCSTPSARGCAYPRGTACMMTVGLPPRAVGGPPLESEEISVVAVT